MSIEGVLFERLLKEYDERLNFLTTRSEKTMATLQDVQNKIDAEKAQVAAAVQGLKDEIQGLKDKLASGEFVTSAQLDGLITSIDGIFDAPAEPAPAEPAPVEPAPEVPAEPVVDPVSNPAPVDGQVA